MKKLLLSLALLLLPSASFAQCNGVFDAHTVCGNETGSAAIPHMMPQSSVTGTPGGTNGQTQYNNSGAFGGYTVGGDCTVVPSTGIFTCLKTNGANFGAFATGTNAGNLTGNQPVGTEPVIAPSTVLSNVTAVSAAAAANGPQAFNQAGFTGIAPCGYTFADNGGPNFNAGSASTTQISINQIGFIILCTGSGWGGVAWTPDPTAIKISNVIGGVFSTNHRLADVTLAAGAGSCTATGVSDETHPACNEAGASCWVLNTPTECTLFIVAKTTTPQTVNDVGFVLSSRAAVSGPTAATQTIYPYWAPYMRNYTTSQATLAAATFRYYIAKLGSLHTVLGDTTVGFGRYVAVASGSTASAFSVLTIPAGFTSPNTKNVEFGIANTGAAASLCGVSPYAAGAGTNWTTAQLDWPNNPGLSNLFIKTGLMGTAGNYGYVSSVAGCSVYVIAYTDSYGGVP